jgi:pimeloyl-ACP methyl ester carboxylesterase
MIVFAVKIALIAGAQASAQPVDAYAQLPSFAGVEISADGRSLAATCPTAQFQRICVYDLNTGGAPVSVPVSDGIALTDFYFPSNTHLLVRTTIQQAVSASSGTDDYSFDRAVVVNFQTGDAAPLMGNVRWSTSNANVISLNRGDPDTVLVEMTLLRTSGIQTGSNIDRAAEYLNQLYRVNLDDGRGRRLDSDRSLYRVVSADGDIMARVYHDIQTGEFQVRAGEQRGAVLYEASHTYDRPAATGFIDATGLAFEMDTEHGRGVFRLDLESAEITDPFGFSETGYQRPLFDRYGQLWGFTARAGDQLVQRIVDEGLRSDQDVFSAALGTEIMIEAFSDDRNKIAFSAAGPGTPHTRYLFERDKGEIGLLSPAYPALAGADLPQRRMISYAASDGLTIPAVLTTPPGFTGEQAAPLVVMPHGGPAARDGVEFDWWAQAIAAQGYVVLQPNFRGSDGYGPEFREAGFGEFGGLMIEDILDGARHLQAEGLAREDGFCLTGASYGGYASLMGAARAPDEVACVIAFAPVTNPITLLGRSSREGGETALAFWEEYIGSRFQSSDRADANSPLAQASRLTMPVLVMHGTLDDVVPAEQSRALARAMGAATTFTYVELENETHYLDLPTSRMDLLSRSLEIFDAVLGDVN